MSGKTGIRWTQGQRSRLSSAVRSYNARLRKALKAANEATKQYLPPLESYKEIKARIVNARQLSVELTRLNRPRKWAEKGRNAFEVIKTEGGITTRQDLEVARVSLRTENVRRAKARIKAGIQKDGVIEKGHTGFMAARNISPLHVKAEELQQWQQRARISRALQSAKETLAYRTAKYFENYSQALATSGIAQSEEAYFEILDIMNRIYETAPHEFEDAFWAYQDGLQIDFIYDDLEAIEARADQILNTWRDIENDLEDKGVLR